MNSKIVFASLIFLGGWLWGYLFVRQFIYNFSVSMPIIKKMNEASDSLIAPTAMKFVWVSIIANFLVCAIIAFVVIHFCPLYLIITFILGGVIAIALSLKNLSYKNKSMFESFCSTYYRFIPDDELRTLMYNGKISQMKVRLHTMDVPYDFIPKFKED